jgi:hypothetical protein
LLNNTKATWNTFNYTKNENNPINMSPRQILMTNRLNEGSKVKNIMICDG